MSDPITLDLDEAFSEVCARFEDAQIAFARGDNEAFTAARLKHELAVLRFNILRGEVTVH